MFLKPPLLLLYMSCVINIDWLGSNIMFWCSYNMLAKLSLCTLWQHMGSGVITPRMLNLGDWWRKVISFTPVPLHPHGNSPPFRWIGCCVGPEFCRGPFSLSRIEKWSVGRSVRSLVIMPMYTVCSRQEQKIYLLSKASRPFLNFKKSHNQW